MYGTSTSDNAKTIKAVPQDERVTYSWNSLNVFANTDVPQNEPSIMCLCCRRNSGQPIQKKHILKNGTVFIV